MSSKTPRPADLDAAELETLATLADPAPDQYTRAIPDTRTARGVCRAIENLVRDATAKGGRATAAPQKVQIRADLFARTVQMTVTTRFDLWD